jgi:hypothetical protein
MLTAVASLTTSPALEMRTTADYTDYTSRRIIIPTLFADG